MMMVYRDTRTMSYSVERESIENSELESKVSKLYHGMLFR